MDLQHPSQQPSEGLKQVLFRLNFYLGGGEVVNLDVDLHLHVLRILLFVLQKHWGHQYLDLNLDLDQHDRQQNFWLYMDLQPHQLLKGGKLQVLFFFNFYLEEGGG